MEEFINNIITFVSQLDPILKIALIGLFTILDILIIINFVKKLGKGDKLKLNIVNILLFIICSGILIFLSIYSF